MRLKKIFFLMICFAVILSQLTVGFAADSSIESQLMLLEENETKWIPDSYSQYSYAVTDLDGNGRLEIFAAVTQGTGIFTSGELYEVNNSFDGIEPAGLMQEEGSFLPEVIVNETEQYSDLQTGLKYYVYSDVTRVGAWENYQAEEALVLDHGKAKTILLAAVYTEADEHENVFRTYYDGNNQLIDEISYHEILDGFFTNCVKKTQNFGWFTLEDGNLRTLLTESYHTFAEAGSEKKSAQEIPVGSNGNITITKNPTAESLSIGGKTWFIAHASGAEMMKWMFTDGVNVYDIEETMALNPGLLLEVLEGDTIAVSNVPASLNGWSVYAVFSNRDFAAATQPAAIYVGDYVSAYGSVIDAYRSAYDSGKIVTEEYAFEKNLSEWIGYAEKIGYAMKDLDKDGIPELIIAGMGENNNTGGVIFEICTLNGNTPVTLCRSHVRDRYYLRTDSTVYNFGSSGAAYSSFCLFRLKNGVLYPVEKLRSDLDDQASAIWFYSPDGSEKEILYSGNAADLIDSYESTIYVPFLTEIS